MSNFSETVKKQHRINRLKVKAGFDHDDDRQGHISKTAISNAQNAIDQKESLCSEEVSAVLIKLEQAWDDLKKEENTKAQKQLTDRLYNFSNNIKDMADTFEYNLMNYFGQSLREFCKKVDISNKAHHVIIQAHIDVMSVSLKNDIKDEGGAVAKELKKTLTQAIEKHS